MNNIQINMHVSQTDLQIARQLELELTEFTEEQIREEVYKIWLSKGITRRRISKLDREAARRNLNHARNVNFE